MPLCGAQWPSLIVLIRRVPAGRVRCRPVSIGTPGCSANPAEPDVLGSLQRAHHRCAACQWRFATPRTPSGRRHVRAEAPPGGGTPSRITHTPHTALAMRRPPNEAVDHAIRVVEALCTGQPDDHEAALQQTFAPFARRRALHESWSDVASPGR